ncbi:hypothetical protein DPMN_042605 [Dreissena polymorpha]|uniref:Uncharacterized protein n=1 Tax=Dreissena polymorpha TaxID=45954 RepID=A0A9D4HUW2_DREPO|nr:hypothetical protein DPMN_042605 [Dreissena polymorpha]
MCIIACQKREQKGDNLMYGDLYQANLRGTGSLNRSGPYYCTSANYSEDSRGCVLKHNAPFCAIEVMSIFGNLSAKSKRKVTERQTDRQTDGRSDHYMPSFGAKVIAKQPTNQPTDQPTNRQGKNNMSPTTILLSNFDKECVRNVNARVFTNKMWRDRRTIDKDRS